MNLEHNIPARASELLISKICHDLVSPIGAVNNGIEFMADMGGEGMEDGIGLIEHSAKQASVKLQLFRMCYGAGGSDAKMTGKIIYETFQNYIADSKVKMDWDLMNAMPDQDLPMGFLKTLLNMMVFAFDSLPRGGVVKVDMMDTHMCVVGIGDMVKPKDDSVDAFEGGVSMDDLSPKSIHGYITKQYALLFGLDVHVSLADDAVTLTLKIP
jgi:histidine phosphotransferase ChpT